jgi:hypothetical protein
MEPSKLLEKLIEEAGLLTGFTFTELPLEQPTSKTATKIREYFMWVISPRRNGVEEQSVGII